MDTRKIVIAFLGLVLFAGGYFGMEFMVSIKKVPKKKANKSVKVVFTQKVENGTVPIKIKNTGSLKAKERVELFAEVQGVFEKRGQMFRAGVKHSKGESIIQINSQEHEANLRAQKSSLQNLIAGLMPDLKLDFPDAYTRWNNYLMQFDVTQPVVDLPKPATEKEKFFLTGRNVFTTFYNVKSLEERLAKYTIRAPFNGVVTEALVTEGSLIRAGQKLGEFINPDAYEMEIAISKQFLSRLQVGKEVKLQNLEGTESWMGKVVRINGKVDQASQTVKVFIEVRDEQLKEGMYLEAVLDAAEEEEAIEISRQLLVNDNQMYVVGDSTLHLITINPVHYNEKTVIVKGIANGTEILAKPVPGAYKGMLVKRYNKKK